MNDFMLKVCSGLIACEIKNQEMKSMELSVHLYDQISGAQ